MAHLGNRNYEVMMSISVTLCFDAIRQIISYFRCTYLSGRLRVLFSYDILLGMAAHVVSGYTMAKAQ